MAVPSVRDTLPQDRISPSVNVKTLLFSTVGGSENIFLEKNPTDSAKNTAKIPDTIRLMIFNFF